MRYRPYYIKENLEAKEKEDEIDLSKEKYCDQIQNYVDIYFKDCFNFYNYIKIDNILDITIKKKVHKKARLPFTILKDSNNIVDYLLDNKKWLLASFVYENHYRTVMLRTLEYLREDLQRDPILITL